MSEKLNRDLRSKVWFGILIFLSLLWGGSVAEGHDKLQPSGCLLGHMAAASTIDILTVHRISRYRKVQY